MKLATRTVAVVAIIVALGASWVAGVPVPDATNDSGRRLIMPATPTAASANHISRSMDSWLRWLLFRSRQADAKSPMNSKVTNLKAPRPEEDDDEFEEFDDPAQQLLMMPESRQSASKRRDDDYGHMRFGKRDFDDYGHMRFGRR